PTLASRQRQATDRAPSSGSRASFEDPVHSWNDPRLENAIEPGKLAIEIGVAFVEQVLLPAGSDPAAGVLAVLAVERVGDVHPFDNAADRHEGLVVLRGRQIGQRDVD